MAPKNVPCSSYVPKSKYPGRIAMQWQSAMRLSANARGQPVREGEGEGKEKVLEQSGQSSDLLPRQKVPLSFSLALVGSFPALLVLFPASSVPFDKSRCQQKLTVGEGKEGGRQDSQLAPEAHSVPLRMFANQYVPSYLRTRRLLPSMITLPERKMARW